MAQPPDDEATPATTSSHSDEELSGLPAVESLDLPHTSSVQLRGLLDAIIAVGSELSLPVVLRRITEAATELVGATYGALGVLNEDNTALAEFIVVGLDEDTTRTPPHDVVSGGSHPDPWLGVRQSLPHRQAQRQ